jgi:hypothetical protein
VLVAAVATVVAVPASGQTGAQTAGYAVVLAQPPAAGYEGNVPGLERTKPAKGKKYNSKSQAAQRYTEYLRGTHREVLEEVDAGAPVYDYTHAVNGFAAQLTEGQAAKLEQTEGVLSVERAEMLEVTTSDTPDFLGLTKPAGQGGLWAKLGGVGPGVGKPGAGEDVIVGVVDTGYWPEHPSFSDRRGSQGGGGGVGQNLYPHPPTGWNGTCQGGEEFPASTCNNKVIGARWFADGVGVGTLPEWEYASPRDFGGHGSHTASEAAGNHGIRPTGDAAAFGPISGMAPRARIAVYKACYVINLATSGSCNSLDTAAGIDAAVADGVDVINYSISGTQTAFTNITEVAFLFAAEAGVYVAASAGNNGAPRFGSVNHPSPWITTVAAGTHNRTGEGSVTTGGETYEGASLSPAAVTANLVEAADAVAAGQDPAEANLCFAAVDNAGVPVLDPAKVAGKIVVCDRGTNALVNKSLAVKTAGGVGVVIVNVDGGATSTLALIHSVPTVHVPFTAPSYAALHAAADAGESATISKGTLVFDVPAPLSAGFSNSGPLAAGAGDILKPDIIAPGQDILGAVAPPGNQDRLFDLYSGTSMSSPHMAGMGALLKQAHPDWSPMAIKSAFMTTAYDIIENFPGTSAISAAAQRTFAQGAGHVDPNKAVDPGLVFDSDFLDWIAFLEGQGLANGPLPPLDASDLNQASIAIGDLAGIQTVTRTATSVGTQSETYTFSVQGLPGITATPSAGSFTIAPGAEREWTVTFTRTSAPLNQYQSGFITWTGNRGHVVRMPVVLRPVALAAPAEVTFETATGPSSWNVKTGYAGTLAASVRGMVAANETAGTVPQDPDQNWINCGDTQGTFTKNITIPVGTTVFRVGIYEDAITPTGTDLDLFVCLGTGLVAFSADGDSNEEVTLNVNPASSPTLTVYVHGFSTNGPSADITLFDWEVPATSAGNTSLAITPPGDTTIGGTKTVTATFTGLAADTRYMGVVDYTDGSTALGRTILRVNTP